MADDEDQDGLLETSATLPVYYDGIRATVINGMLHLVFWVRQPSVDANATEKVVVSRMVTRTAQSGQDRDVINIALELAAEVSKSSH